MALAVTAMSGSGLNAFNPVYVGAAMVKGGAPYALVALVGVFGTAGAALVCASLMTPALAGGNALLVVAAVTLFGAIVPYVHGVQGQLVGRLLADRRDDFSHFGAL